MERKEPNRGSAGGPTTMKLCPHCSASLADDSVRCSACGKWIIPSRTGKKGTRRRKGSRIRLLVFLGLAILAWAVWATPGGRIDPRELLELKPTQGRLFRILQQELERLNQLEEEYFREHGEYSGIPGALGFTARQGVTVSIIATPTGWSGAAVHEALSPDGGCAIYQGSASPPRVPIRPSEPGAVDCTMDTEG